MQDQDGQGTSTGFTGAKHASKCRHLGCDVYDRYSRGHLVHWNEQGEGQKNMDLNPPSLQYFIEGLWLTCRNREHTWY